MITDWDLLCMTITLEIGHLLGHSHQDASPSIMSPVFSSYAAEPAACRTGRPALGGQSLLPRSASPRRLSSYQPDVVRAMNTRTIALIALVIAVVVLIMLVM